MIATCAYCHAPCLDKLETAADDVERCRRVVAAFFFVPASHVLSPQRRGQAAVARYVLFHLLRRRWRLGEVARATGFDHATVFDGVKAIKSRMESCPEFARDVAELAEALPVLSRERKRMERMEERR